MDINIKNNKSGYVLKEYNQLEIEETASDEEVDKLTEKILSKHVEAFKELAK